jgi:tetratricopeptide (TPR) repeat protein
MAREKGDFTEALKLAEEQIFRAPEKWWGYLARAQAMQGLKRDEDASIAYIKLISMRPEVPNSYLVSGRYFVGKNDYEHATEAFRIGLSKYKDHPILNLTYADILLQDINDFFEIPKYRLHALIGLCEIFTAQNRNDDLKSHTNLLRKFIIEHTMGENEKKLFSNRVKPFFN